MGTKGGTCGFLEAMCLLRISDLGAGRPACCTAKGDRYAASGTMTGPPDASCSDRRLSIPLTVSLTAGSSISSSTLSAPLKLPTAAATTRTHWSSSMRAWWAILWGT